MNMYKVYFIGQGYEVTAMTVVMADTPQQAMDIARGDYTGEMECEEI